MSSLDRFVPKDKHRHAVKLFMFPAIVADRFKKNKIVVQMAVPFFIGLDGCCDGTVITKKKLTT